MLDWTTISGTDAWDGRGLPEQLPLQGTLHLSLRATTASGAGEAVDAGTFTVWTPKELDRVVLWLDPTDPAVAYADNRCSTAATVDQPVRCIVDKSGGPHTFIHDGEGAPYKAPVLRELAPGRAVDFRDDGILYTPSTSWLSFSDAGLVFALVDRPGPVGVDRPGHPVGDHHPAAAHRHL